MICRMILEFTYLLKEYEIVKVEEIKNIVRHFLKRICFLFCYERPTFCNEWLHLYWPDNLFQGGYNNVSLCKKNCQGPTQGMKYITWGIQRKWPRSGISQRTKEAWTQESALAMCQNYEAKWNSSLSCTCPLSDSSRGRNNSFVWKKRWYDRGKPKTDCNAFC